MCGHVVEKPVLYVENCLVWGLWEEAHSPSPESSQISSWGVKVFIIRVTPLVWHPVNTSWTHVPFLLLHFHIYFKPQTSPVSDLCPQIMLPQQLSLPALLRITGQLLLTFWFALEHSLPFQIHHYISNKLLSTIYTTIFIRDLNTLICTIPWVHNNIKN